MYFTQKSYYFIWSDSYFLDLPGLLFSDSPLLSGMASLVPSIASHCRWPRLLSVGKHSALPAPERPCLLWLPRRPRLTFPSGPWEAFFLVRSPPDAPPYAPDAPPYAPDAPPYAPEAPPYAPEAPPYAHSSPRELPWRLEFASPLRHLIALG